jgi:hypothetical protein
VPEGETPYVDPNERYRVCKWLRGNETGRDVR